MITFLKAAAVIACMVAIIPLAVWAGSGRFSHGLHALKQFLIAMGWLVVPVVVVALIASMPW
ncbi:hypothetical protein [Hydrogenophaga sp.]|uniref:hypothetical protein n=1 Tax=Hydrogenophaga sp. TaxID=1904254 RepID=UPI003F728D6B